MTSQSCRREKLINCNYLYLGCVTSKSHSTSEYLYKSHLSLRKYYWYLPKATCGSIDDVAVHLTSILADTCANWCICLGEWLMWMTLQRSLKVAYQVINSPKQDERDTEGPLVPDLKSQNNTHSGHHYSYTLWYLHPKIRGGEVPWLTVTWFHTVTSDNDVQEAIIQLL